MKKLIISLFLFLFPVIAFSAEVSVTPTVTGSVTNYTAGDCVGGLMTFTGLFSKVPNTGVINTVIVSDIGAEGQNLDLVLFPYLPTGTFTDNSACTVADASLYGARVIPINTHTAFADNGVSIASPNIWIATGGGTVYGVLVARNSAGYFYDSTTALSITLVGVPD